MSRGQRKYPRTDGSLCANVPNSGVPAQSKNKYEPSFMQPFPWVPRSHKESHQCYVCIRSLKIFDMSAYVDDNRRIMYICDDCIMKCVECEQQTNNRIDIRGCSYADFQKRWDYTDGCPELMALEDIAFLQTEIVMNKAQLPCCYIRCCWDCRDKFYKGGNFWITTIDNRIIRAQEMRADRAKKLEEEKAIHDMYKPGGDGFDVAKKSFEKAIETGALD